jgi:hypothetical protein
VSIHDESGVIFAKVTCSSNFNLNLSEFLSDCCSTRIEIIIYIFNVENNVFCHSFSTKQSFEFVLEISFLINFISLHSFNINDMNELRNLVYQYHWTNASHEFGKRSRKDS